MYSNTSRRAASRVGYARRLILSRFSNWKKLSATASDGSSITNSFDDDGDGVIDRIQTIVTVVNGDSSETETVTNKVGNDPATAVLFDQTVTTTSADGATITIDRDSTGGGWFDQTEVRTTHADDSLTIDLTDKSQKSARFVG